MFTAVAEVHVLPAVDDYDKFIAQASGQHVVCDTDLGEVPAKLSTFPGDTLVNQPEMYSAQKIDLDGIPMEEVVVPEPLEFSAPDASLDSRPIAGNIDWNPSEHVVHTDEQSRRPTEDVTSPAPVRHSVMQFYLDSQPGKHRSKPDQPGDLCPNGTPRRQVDVCGSQTVPEFLVDTNMDRRGNPVPKPAPLELAEYLTSVEHSLRQNGPNENRGGNPVPKPAPSELAEHLTSVEHRPRSKYTTEDKGGDPVPKPAPSGLAEHSTSVENSPGPGYPMPNDKSGRRVCFHNSRTVPNRLVDFRATGGGNPVPKPAPSELAEHSTSVEHPSGPPRRVVRVSDNQPVSEPRQSDNQEIRKSASIRTPRGVMRGSANQPVSELGRSDNQTVRQLAGVGTQRERPEWLEIAQQPRSKGRLLPETDGVPRPPPVALPQSSRVHDSRRT